MKTIFISLILTLILSDFVYSQNYGYTGECQDETGLIYLRERCYDASTGSFITKDPLGISSGPNAYTYAISNPVNLIDPLGTDALYFVGAGNAEAGAGVSPTYGVFLSAAQAQAAAYTKANPGQQAYIVQVASKSDVINALSQYSTAIP